MSTQGLLLDEDFLRGIPEGKRSQLVISWTQTLEDAIDSNTFGNIPLEKLCDQVYSQLLVTHSKISRVCIGHCLAKLLNRSSPVTLLNILNRCNDLLRQDGPSLSNNQLAALDCLSCVFSVLKTTIGRCHEEAVNLICKLLKANEPQSRLALLQAMKTIFDSVNTDSAAMSKEVVKTAKFLSKDPNADVRACLYLCLTGFVGKCVLPDNEFDILFNLCLKNCSDSSPVVRDSISQLLGILCSVSHKDFTTANKTKADSQRRKLTTEQTLLPLKNTFSKGLYGFMRGTTDKLIGGGSTKKDVRAAIAHSYVTFALSMGPKWLEDNVEPFLREVLHLLSNVDVTEDDGVSLRQNVMLVLQSTLGKILSSTAQILAAKELLKKTATFKTALDKENLPPADSISTRLSMVSCLDMVAFLLLENDTLVTRLIDDSTNSVVDLFFSFLVYPPSVRIASALCLRSVAKAYPLQLSKLIDRTIEYMNSSSRSADGISGYSCALAVLLSCVRESPFGISKTRVKIIFNTAEELLRTNQQTGLHQVKSGWLIIGALLSAGMAPLQNEIPRVFHLWRNVFGSASKEQDEQKKRAEQPVSVIANLFDRVGALSSMYSFVRSCDLKDRQELSKKFAAILEMAITAVVSTELPVSNASRTAEAQILLLKTKLYDVAYLLDSKLSKGYPITLLKSLLADIVTSKGYLTKTNSILEAFVDSEEACRPLFEQFACDLGSNWTRSSSSAVYQLDEHQLYLGYPGDVGFNQNVRLVDSAIKLYSKMPSMISPKHVSDSISYFQEVLNDSKHKVDEYTYTNIITSILLLTKSLEESGTQWPYDATAKALVSIMLGGVTSNNNYVRVASFNSIAYLVSICKEPKISGDIVESCLERLKGKLEFPVSSALAACFALKASKVATGSAQLSNVISVLLKCAQDSSTLPQQKWAMYGLLMMADSLGPSFRSFVETSISLCFKLVFTSANVSDETLVFTGKLLGSSIMILGPELGSRNIKDPSLQTIINICHVLRQQDSPWLQCAAIDCLQKLHLFNRNVVKLPKVLQLVSLALLSSFGELQKTALLFLKQLVQREPLTIHDSTSKFIPAIVESSQKIALSYRLRNIPSAEDSLGSLLFKLLDVERSGIISDYIKSTMLVIFASPDTFSICLQLCREVVTASQEMPKAEDGAELQSPDSPDDEERCKATEETAVVSYASYCTSTKNFAVQCVQNVLLMLSESAQSSLSILGDVIRVAFIAALSPMDSLRLEGLRALQILIDKFSSVDDPAYEGHSVLEQYQAQIAAALRPSFENDTSPDVGIVACNVLSSWMRGGGASDEYQIQRSYGLLKSGYNRLICNCTSKELQSCTHKAFSESANGGQKLAVLKAWAELYIHFIAKDSPVTIFLKQDQHLLSSLWIRALTDHARAMLPVELKLHVQEIGFYSDESESSRRAWTVILQATALWLTTDKEAFDTLPKRSTGNPQDILRSLAALALEHMCNCRASEGFGPVLSCLVALQELSNFCEQHPSFLSEDLLSPDALHIIHRMVLTKPQVEVHIVIVELLLKLVSAASKLRGQPDYVDNDAQVSDRRSTSFCVLEICYSLLARHLADSSMLIKRDSLKQPPFRHLSLDVEKIVCGILQIFENLPNNAAQADHFLPTVLHAAFVVLFQSAFRPVGSTECLAESNTVTRASIKLIRSLMNQADTVKEATVRLVLKLLECSGGTTVKEWQFDPVTRIVLVAILMKSDVPVQSKPILDRTCRQALSELETLTTTEQTKILQILHSIFQTCLPCHLPLIVKTTSTTIFQTISKLSIRPALTTEEVKVYLECLSCVEKLVERAESEKRTLVLNILVTALVNMSLMSDTRLKDVAKVKIQSLVSAYPDNVKQLLHNSDLRQRITLLL